jgi:serine/threonine protein kinase
VYLGYLNNHRTHEQRQQVAIKRIRPGVTSEQLSGFFSEIASLKDLEHANVVNILGAVTQSDPVMMVTEYCVFGGLDQYLRNNATHPQNVRLGEWSEQMASALVYLHSKNIVHRDLACRNFLVAGDKTIRLCDLGMCKNLDYLNEYYQKHEVNVAVRWAAPECLIRGMFNRGTDTWAMCVTYVEMYSFGQEPYAEFKSPREVYEGILAGVRIQPPNNMPTAMARIVSFVFQQRSMVDINMELFQGVLLPVRHAHEVESIV